MQGINRMSPAMEEGEPVRRGLEREKCQYQKTGWFMFQDTWWKRN